MNNHNDCGHSDEEHEQMAREIDEAYNYWHKEITDGMHSVRPELTNIVSHKDFSYAFAMFETFMVEQGILPVALVGRLNVAFFGAMSFALALKAKGWDGELAEPSLDWLEGIDLSGLEG